MKAKKDFSLDTDSDDEDEGGDVSQVKVKSTFLDEKAAALHALGEFANACPLKFEAYFERAFAILDTTYQYFHDNVRMQTVICYRNLVEALVKCVHGGKLPEFRRGLPCIDRYPQKIEDLLSIEIWTKLNFFMTEEADPEIVARAVDGMTELVKALGPVFYRNFLDELIQTIFKLLEGQCACHNPASDDEDEDETIALVFEQVTDLIPALAKTLSTGFELPFSKIANSLSAYLDTENRDINDNIQAVGCFAITFKHVPSLIPQYQGDLLPQLYQMVEMGDDELSRNISFCLGVMVQRNIKAMTKELPRVMLALKGVFDRAKDQACKDNAAAALCRIILVAPDQVPLPQAIQTILNTAPFTGDEEEEKTILEMLVFLVQQQGDLLLAHIQKVVALLIDGLANIKKYKLKPELEGKVAGIVRQLAANEQYKALMEAIVVALPEEQRNEVVKRI